MAMMKVVVSSPFVGTDEVDYIELPHDWDEMTDEEKEDFENEVWDEAVVNYVDGYCEIVEDED